ncbi:MAG: restriction endonuclease subunit S, partial [Akkermansiaceae bacterium]
MSEWKSAKLGDIAEMCLGKMLDKEKNKGELQPYLANVNLRWGGFDLSNLSTMRFEESESERYGLESGDLVVCEGGEPGRCAIWRGEVPQMKIQKAIHRVRTNKNYSNEFVYYRFLLAGRSGELSKHFIGSTIKHLTGYSLKQVEFNYPPLAEQSR